MLKESWKKFLDKYMRSPAEQIDISKFDEEEMRRYDIIEKLLTEFILKEELRNELNEIYDLERLSSRIKRFIRFVS